MTGAAKPSWAVPLQTPACDARVPGVDVLRGVASFGVAWFHFTNGTPGFLGEGWLKRSGQYGWVGVQVFFVISGFVIPYALHRSGYRWGEFGRFLMKRVIRLDPPYLSAIGLAVLLTYAAWLSPSFAGSPPAFTARQLIFHLGYLNSIAGEPWVNPVFWSLGIEFQYYLMIGLAFPLLVAPNRFVRLASVALMVLPALLVAEQSLLFVHLPLFVMGLFTFQSSVGLVDRGTCALGTLMAAVAVWGTSGTVAAIAGVATVALMNSAWLKSRVLMWLGTISYSLYLVHIPIGGRVVNLGARVAEGTLAEVGVLVAASASSIGAAWIFYWAVERPSQTLSARLAYRTPPNERSRSSHSDPTPAPDPTTLSVPHSGRPREQRSCRSYPPGDEDPFG